MVSYIQIYIHPHNWDHGGKLDTDWEFPVLFNCPATVLSRRRIGWRLLVATCPSLSTGRYRRATERRMFCCTYYPAISRLYTLYWFPQIQMIRSPFPPGCSWLRQPSYCTCLLASGCDGQTTVFAWLQMILTTKLLVLAGCSCSSDQATIVAWLHLVPMTRSLFPFDWSHFWSQIAISAWLQLIPPPSSPLLPGCRRLLGAATASSVPPPHPWLSRQPIHFTNGMSRAWRGLMRSYWDSALGCRTLSFRTLVPVYNRAAHRGRSRAATAAGSGSGLGSRLPIL